MVSKGRYIGYTWPSCHISSKVQLPKPPLCGRKDHLVKTTISLQQLNLLWGAQFHLLTLKIRHSGISQTPTRTTPPQNLSQSSRGASAPSSPMSLFSSSSQRVVLLFRASARTCGSSHPDALIAKDLPPGRRSKLMFSMVENSGWETNPKYHHANHSFH